MKRRKDPAAPSAKGPPPHGAWLRISLLALVVTLVVELFNHKAFTAGPASLFRFAVENPLALAVDALIVLLTLLPALFFRRRVFWCALVSAIWVVAGGANGFILLNRMTPFTIADLTVLNTGLDTLPNYLSPGYMLLLAAALAAAVLGLALLFWKGPQCEKSRQKRCYSAILALLTASMALAGTWTLAFRVNQLSSVFANLAYAYEDYGFPYCFLQTWLNRGIRPPVDYDSRTVAQVLETLAGDTPTPAAPAQTDVNVVYVQLESFIDPAEIKGLTLSENPVPNWTALTAADSSGYLTVPVVGAGTANTECEVLTDMSVRFFGPGEYPYQTRLLGRTAESVAYDLKANGYATHAIHNHQATFYKRNEVYPNLGFDDFTSLEYMPKTAETPKNWAKDAVLTGQITQALDATPDQKDLVFTVSVQGHGKYPTEPVLTNPAVTVETCPNETYRYALEYYVNQIREMDTFIGELTAALAARPEKTVLVLYGDHLPSLGLRDRDMVCGSLYRTRYVIWDNFGLEKQDEDLTAYQLSASVLGRLGITTGVMNAFQQFYREEPSYRTDLKLLQYDTLYGRRYLYEEDYAPTDMEMGSAPITLSALIPRGDIYFLTGQHFTPYCQVTVDGRRLKTEYLSPELLRIMENPGTENVDDLSISVVDQHRQTLSDTE